MGLNTNVTLKEIESRKEAIEDQLILLFKANMKITDWMSLKRMTRKLPSLYAKYCRINLTR